MTTHTITVTVNGVKEYLDVPSQLTLLEMLRTRLALTGRGVRCLYRAIERRTRQLVHGAGRRSR
jgi:aerobic-type carbon monoxide dehydrogenase small subunit (CoxS/CutS family)